MAVKKMDTTETKKMETTAVKVADKEVKAAVTEGKAEVKETVKEVKAPKTVTAKAAKSTKTTKAAVKKTAQQEEKYAKLYLQYAGKEYTDEDIINKAKEAWAAETGKRTSSIKTIDVYCKPEENAAYYVVNKKYASKVDL